MLNIGIFVEGTFLPSYEGATRRFLALARWLTRKGISVTVFHCYRGWSNIKQIADEPYRTYILPPDLYYNNFKFLEGLLRQHQIQAIVMNEFYPIIKFGWLLKKTMPHLRLIFEVHDVHTEIAVAAAKTNDHIMQTLLAEKLAYYVADLCICFSVEDAEAVKRIINHTVFNQSSFAEYDTLAQLSTTEAVDKVISLPFGCDRGNIQVWGSNTAVKNVLFLGNLYHSPNTKAVEFLATCVYPGVIDHLPEVKFFMVGDAPLWLIERYQRENFLFLGKVADLNSVFKETTLAVSPVFSGTGIRVKVLDYCMADLPILCTTRAIRGLPKSVVENTPGLILEDDPDQYVKQIVSLLIESNRTFIEYSTINVAKTQYWELTIESVLSAYSTCIEKPPYKITIDLDKFSNIWDQGSYFQKNYLNPGRFSYDKTLTITTPLICENGQIQPIKKFDN